MTRCRMHYRKELRDFCPHGQMGTILLTHRGRRLVQLDSGRRVTCSMWNAVPLKKGEDDV